jgi:Domain of unknown function DUF11
MKNTQNCFLAIIIIILQFPFYTNGQSNSKIDLKLQSTSENRIVQIGAEAQINITLENQSSVEGTNIKVFINIPYFPPFVKFVSANPLKGSFDITTGLWTVPVVKPLETIKLVLKYIPMQYGVWYAEAEIYSSNENDSDSTPNNKMDMEDDFTRTCISMPIKVPTSTFGRQIILDDSKITNIVWKKDDQTILNQTSNTLQVTTVGSYGFSSPTFICPSQGCCPYIFEQGSSPFCCESLEFGLSRVSNTASSNPTVLNIIGSNENMQDADVSSIVPNTNYANNEFMNPYAWTQNGILNVKRNYLKFDLSSIPQNAVIDSAYLSLYFGQKLIDLNPIFSGHTGENQLEIQRVLEDWSENTINWNNKPPTSPANLLIVPKFTDLKQNYLNLKVTNLVSDMIKNGNFGFMIKHQVEEPYKITAFATSESINASIRPKLNVYYH